MMYDEGSLLKCGEIMFDIFSKSALDTELNRHKKKNHSLVRRHSVGDKLPLCHPTVLTIQTKIPTCHWPGQCMP